MKHRILSALSALLVVTVAMFVAASPTARAGHQDGNQGFEGEELPIVFVHGFTGSGAQYESQALRWASNDYPNVVTAIDRISATPSVIYPILDAFFDDLIAQTGSPKVYALGHSQGTSVMNGYLNSSPERAARVAKYIGIDGATSAGCPGGTDPVTGEWRTPCMGIWGRGSTSRMLGPDHNIYLSTQAHTESVVSPESFAAQYRFFTGQEPTTTLILPEPPGKVRISGRALNYPANTGIDGATVQLWEVNTNTGARKNATPDQEVVVDATGNWGPWAVNGQQRYELTVIRQADDGARYNHFYFEPWTRSNSLIKLNLSPIGSTLANAITAHAGPHSGASIVRQKEWWGSIPSSPGFGGVFGPDTPLDQLFISVNSAGAGAVGPDNIVNGATASGNSATNAMITFDVNADQTSNLAVLTPLGPFLAGVDYYMPAPADPPDGSIRFDARQRGEGAAQVINTPNWQQDARHFMTVAFRDWVQEINTWGQCKSAKPSPCK